MKALGNIGMMIIALWSCHTALADSVVIGTVYTIAEQDAEEEIKQRAAKANWKDVYNLPPDKWAGFVSVKLPNATADNERTHQIVYTVEQDIIDRQGNVLYPKGYRYNSLDYISMPYRIIVIGNSPEQVAWAKKEARDEDEIWTAGGNPRQLSQQFDGKPVYILTEDAASKLALRAVPTVISQFGNSLLLEEHYVQTN